MTGGAKISGYDVVQRILQATGGFNRVYVEPLTSAFAIEVIGNALLEAETGALQRAYEKVRFLRDAIPDRPDGTAQPTKRQLDEALKVIAKLDPKIRIGTMDQFHTETMDMPKLDKRVELAIKRLDELISYCRGERRFPPDQSTYKRINDNTPYVVYCTDCLQKYLPAELFRPKYVAKFVPCNGCGSVLDVTLRQAWFVRA